VELRGLLSASGIALSNIDNPLFFSKKSIANAAVGGRIMLDAKVFDHWSFEAHLTQDYVPLEVRTGGSRLVALVDVERSDLFDWSFASGRSHLLLDRLNLQYASSAVSVKVGRQPVNLAATFYFTPNDFFAPFAATAFFRDYKPGMDAARADIRLGELSQLSLISVLGYRPDPMSDNGWSNRPQAVRNGYLARASGVFGDFELAVLGGMVKKDRVLGGDFQGELFECLGVRGEGHSRWFDAPLPGVKRQVVEFAVGLEHRFESSLTLRAEQYYHGSGSRTPGTYALAGNTRYLARNYTAAGASYEFTPLLTGDMTLLHNWDDDSGLAAAYLLYSLSDESELAFTTSLAHGNRPIGSAIQSEFGLYPAAASLEYRGYF